MPTKEITTLSITSSDQDLLGRKNIVSAITNKIVDRSKSNIHCEVIGVYSKWGEGKTSVLNLVKEQLKIQKGDKKREIRCIDFNPWLFKDQESLLLDFFKVLQKGATNNDVKEKLKQYGPLVALGAKGLINIMAPGIGAMAGGAIKEVIKSISDVEIDVLSLKKEIDDQIKLANEHYLIFIDDVDRLDKDELHALFKLIRQNADFVNTTYIIAMDVDMVAKSIGHKFEDGCTEAGKNFLEKIVQYPVHLPKVQQGDISKIFKRIIINEIKTSYSLGVGTSTLPWDELESDLLEYVLPLFSTVRQILLYKNSLSFILPHVYREVNISDLCLLEAIKLFHSDAYYLIRDNKYLITNSESKFLFKYLNEEPDNKRVRIQSFIDSLSKNAEPNIKLIVEMIINKILFPIKSPNSYHLETDKNKSLCSLSYFDKYFLYTTPNDMISDVMYDNFIESLSSINESDLLQDFENYFKLYGYEELMRIINQMLFVRRVNNIDNNCIKKVCVVLSRLSVNELRYGFTFDENETRIEFHICNIINRYINDVDYSTLGSPVIVNEEKQIETLSEILSAETLYPFHLFFVAHFCQKCNVYFSNEKTINRIIGEMINKYVAENGVAELFDLTQDSIIQMLGIWKSKNPSEFSRMIDKYIENENTDVVALVQKMIDKRDEALYNAFCKLFTADKIYDIVKEKDRNEIYEYHKSVGYFIYMYESNTSENSN